MSQSLKIAIIGDYNFTYNSHHATNMAIDHAAYFLDIDANYYWIKLNEVINFKSLQFDQYDGIWIAPGPIKNFFFLHGIIKKIISKQIPILITGDAYKTLIEVLISTYLLDTKNEKLISENLVEGEQFEKIVISPNSKELNQLYENYSNIELTSNRYSLYPKLIEYLNNNIADIDANDDSEDNLSEGPWVLVASSFGLGKRVPVTQFRLQKRAGMGLKSIKFRITNDVLVGLKVLGKGEEILLVTEKGVIVRTNADKISQQSRAATGVKLQKLDEGDHLAEVVLVPHEQIEDENIEQINNT